MMDEVSIHWRSHTGGAKREVNPKRTWKLTYYKACGRPFLPLSAVFPKAALQAFKASR